MSNFGWDNGEDDLWKKLWNVCITFCIFLSKTEDSSICVLEKQIKTKHLEIKVELWRRMQPFIHRL